MKKITELMAITLVVAVGIGFFAGCADTDDEIIQVPTQVDLKAPPEGMPHNLTILHTNDLHGNAETFGRLDMGGQARHAWLIRKIRKINQSKEAATLVVDAGDTREGTVFSDATRTSGMWHIMNMIGYDATVMGNHDHLFGIEAMYDELTAAFADDITTDGSGNPVYGQKTKVLWGNVNPTRINRCTQAQGGKFVELPSVVKDSLENAFAAPDPAAANSCDRNIYPATINPNSMTAVDDDTSKLFNQTLFYDYDMDDDGNRDIRVGLFGVTTDEVIYTFIPAEPTELSGYSLPAGITGEGAIFYSADPREKDYVNQIIDYLDDPDGNPATDDGADVIICLSHIGAGGEMNIAKNALGPESGRYIDVLVGGHSHTQLNKAVEIEHEGGTKKTYVVQADWGGLFLGRADLLVQNGWAQVVNSALIEVDSNVPKAKDVKNYINETYNKTGGIIDWFYNITGLEPRDKVGNLEVNLDHNKFSGENPLCNLVTKALYWQGHDNSIFTIPDNGNPNHGSLGRTDFAVMVPFVLHTGKDLLTKGDLPAGRMLDVLHIHDLKRDREHGNTMHILELAPLPPGGVDLPDIIVPGGVHFDSQIELTLEMVYGIEDLLKSFGAEEYVPMVKSYIGDLQWRGINFEVDFQKDPFKRIDISSIKINDRAPEDDRYYYMSINSTIARFIGVLGAILKDDAGLDFLRWDPAWSDTGVTEWEALLNYVRNEVPGGAITSELVELTGNGVRSVQPDLALQRWDITFDPPNPSPGDVVEVRSWILNLGMTSVSEAKVIYTYDPTPQKLDDNPDGYTDHKTGFYTRYIGTDRVRDVPRFSNYPGVKATDGVQWKIPADLSRGKYRICAEIRNVVSSRPEILTGNNSGKGLCREVTIR